MSVIPLYSKRRKEDCDCWKVGVKLTGHPGSLLFTCSRCGQTQEAEVAEPVTTEEQGDWVRFVRLRQELLPELPSPPEGCRIEDLLWAAEQSGSQQHLHLSATEPKLLWRSAIYEVLPNSRLRLLKEDFSEGGPL